MNSKGTIVATHNLFKENSNFILIGLTGRTGSGCSTAARLLSGNLNLDFPNINEFELHVNDAAKLDIVKSYLKENLEPFVWLQVRNVITEFILRNSFEDFCEYTLGMINKNLSEKFDSLEDIKKKLAPIKSEYQRYFNKIKNICISIETGSNSEEELKKLYSLYFDDLKVFTDQLRAALKTLGEECFTTLFQEIGNNIRSSGNALSKDFSGDNFFALAKRIDDVIKSIRHNKDRMGEPCHIAIDAIRNPYEGFYFKGRYSSFYLVSINSTNQERITALKNKAEFHENYIKELDAKENPKSLDGEDRYVKQDIQKCIEISDIHIHNQNKNIDDLNPLRYQLAWYVSLMLHPGLVTPTSEERSMQLAFTAKVNSGCISRQVGAIVTDKHFSIKGIGWNSVPQGQVPCILRSASDLINNQNKDRYSDFELAIPLTEVQLTSFEDEPPFKNSIKKVFLNENISNQELKGRNDCYCFKDIKNAVKKDKNQVHTRSLHAEENAFLQISKYGGQGVFEGNLFTTASPCELCAKKAYQLGIKNIYYIDPYPGISETHIMGYKNSNQPFPKLKLFRGATGRAYHQLYLPLLPFKDELAMLVPINQNINSLQKETKDQKRIRELEAEIEDLKLQKNSKAEVIN